MTNSHLDQLVITLPRNESLEFEEQYVRLVSLLTYAKAHGRYRKNVLKKNDLLKLVFRLGMNVIRTLNYPQLARKLKMSEQAHISARRK